MRIRLPLLVGMVTISTLVMPGFAVAQTAESPLIETQRLSLETALRVARAALDACRDKGVQVAVTVVDRGGHPQVVLRDVLAVDLTLEASRQKAYTAMSFASPTSRLESRFTEPYSVAKLDDVLPSAGGQPITAAGATVGGVGVSGAASGQTDEECARAGVDEVEMDLEMSGM